MTVKQILKHCVTELAADSPGNIHDFWRTKLDGAYQVEQSYNLITEDVRQAYFAVLHAYNASDDIKAFDGLDDDELDRLYERFYTLFTEAEVKVWCC